MNLRTQMEKVINKSYRNTAGVIVKKNGETVYEKYYKGYNADNTFHVASVTKSIVSALIGIALDNGYINSIDDKILDYFPDYKFNQGDKTIQKVTIKDMLTMTAPYKCKTEPYVKVFTGKHWINMALDILGGNGPIGEFRYSPMVGIHILSGILAKTTGTSVMEFATENLFNPLEISVKKNIELHSKEENISFLEAKDISGWVVDPEGINTAGFGLTLTVKDMAKIGHLYLNEGMWNNNQIIPADWIKESTSEHSRCKQWKLSYGYLWWIIDSKEHAYAAMGDGGNTIYVNESKNIVIAILCSYMPKAKDRLALIKKYIEPVFEK